MAGVLAGGRTLEEAPGGLLVPLGARQEVDRLPRAVDRPVEVAPLAADPDEGLVEVPRPTAGAQVAARPLLELGGEALDPAIQGRVVDRDPTVSEHPLEVAVADGELQIPPDRLEDDLGREAEAAEGPGRGHGQRSRRGRWRERRSYPLTGRRSMQQILNPGRGETCAKGWEDPRGGLLLSRCLRPHLRRAFRLTNDPLGSIVEASGATPTVGTTALVRDRVPMLPAAPSQRVSSVCI
jgi:hypothetical protein